VPQITHVGFIPNSGSEFYIKPNQDGSINVNGINLGSDINIGAVEIQDTSSGSRVNVFKDGDVGGTVNGIPVIGQYNATTPSYADGEVGVLQLNNQGSLKVTGGASSVNAEYKSPDDFTATYTSSTTITLSGLPLTITDSSQITYVTVIPASGTAQTYTQATNGVTLTVSSNVITIAGAGTPFASGDVYQVGISAQEKAYDPTTDVTKIINQSPDRASYVLDSLLDTTNIAAATNYYPSATGMSMDGFKDLSLTGKLIDADGTMTLTIEATNDEDTTNADWIDASLTFKDVKTGINVIAAALTLTNTTLTLGLETDNFNFSYFRVKLVNDGATNTGIIKVRRKSL